MSAPIRIVLVDDHAIVLAGLVQVLGLERDFEVAGTAHDATSALAVIDAAKPDVAVLDVRLGAGDGLALARTLRDRGPRPRLILLTASLDDDQALEAMRLDIPGIVLKDMPAEALVECIRRVHAGGEWHAPEPVRRALRRMIRQEGASHDAGQALTPRELEITRLVVEGLRNKEVAARLGITEGTVKIHLHRVYEKLGIDGRVELIFWAQARGL